jgi:hypothetical protein
VAAIVCLLSWTFSSSSAIHAQSGDSAKPVPILSGSAGYFTTITGGQNDLNLQINPVLLVPLGDN